jgi:crotonobetainyl-CoA:carnitine CoA-transferase CaiB-like acyl-CoA transferase
MTTEHEESRALLALLWSALDGPEAALPRVDFTEAGSFSSVFAVSSLAAASIAAAGLAAADLAEGRRVSADRRLSSMWFAMASRPQGWTAPPLWGAIAGDYRGSDGWIRLHTNAPHHSAIAARALGCAEDRAAVTAATAAWPVHELEAKIVAAGGCAAAMRSAEAWAAHPQGAAVAAEPLLHLEKRAGERRPVPGPPDRPLQGVRVLDLTRVLAGPVATRFLAGLGAEVLRIDPPWWDEAAIAHEVTRGKTCARLDLREADQRARLIDLLRGADILIHGYRPGALDGLGLSAEARRSVTPELIDVSLDAYGWTGPWAGRRGFDSLVQMSCGVAEAGMRLLGRDKPTPLPVQALDHAQGYLLAASALRGLRHRATAGGGWRSRSSLARVATLLLQYPGDPDAPGLAPETEADLSETTEATPWGPLRWLKPPIEIDGAPLRWDLPAGPLGAGEAAWR